jgi:hypothetical protein
MRWEAWALLALIGTLAFIPRWVWHAYVLRHTVTRHDAIQPTYRSPGGINVYEQTEFTIPVAHRKCSCGEIWT